MGNGRRDKLRNESGSFLKALLTNSEEIVLVIDQNGDIQYANPMAESKLIPNHAELNGVHLGLPALEGKFQVSLINEPHNLLMMQVSRLGTSMLVVIRDLKKTNPQQTNPVLYSGVARVGTWRLDLIEYQFWWTDLTKEILGSQAYSSGSFENFIKFVAEDMHENVRQLLHRDWIESDVIEIDLPVSTETGVSFWIHVICQPEFINGELVALKGTFQDITKQHQAETQLSASEKRFKRVFDHSINGLGLCDVVTDENGSVIDLVVIYINPAYERILRLEKDEILGKSVRDLIYWEDDANLLKKVIKVAQTGKPLHFQYHTPQGDLHYSISVFQPTKSQLAIDVKDISESVNSQVVALLKSEKKFRQLFEHSINGFALHEVVRNQEGEVVDFRYLDANDAFEVHTGIKCDDAIGKLATEVLPGIENSDLIKTYADVATTGVAIRFETFYEPLQRYYIITAFSPEPNQFATIFTDITESMTAVEAIKESEQDFRTLFNSMAQGIVYLDKNGRIISANKAAEHILGLSLEELKGLRSYDDCWKTIKMNGDPLPGAEHPAMIALRTGKPVEGYAFGVLNHKGNDIVWIVASAVPQFREGEGEPYQVFTTFQEITDQIRVQQALEERIKELRSLSRVGRIAHQESELEKFCQLVGSELVNGMQYPNLAVATIEFQGQKFSTDDTISETPYKLTTPIQVHNEEIGHVSVFYDEEKPFILPEERTLLEGIAKWASLWFEQRQTQGRLLESERRFRNAILKAPNPIMIHTEEGEVLEVNEAWLKSTGYSREEIKTIPEWIRLAHPEIGEEIKARIQRSYAKTFKGHQGVFPVQTRSGEKLDWNFSSALLGSLPNNQSIVITIAIDITDRIRAEEEKRDFYNRIIALSEIDQVIVSTLELDEVLDLITSQLGNLINYDSMSILAIDGDDLQVIACKGFDDPEEIMGFRFPSRPGYPNYEIVKNQTPMALTDVSKEYPTFQQPSQSNLRGDIKAWLGIPLFNRHEVIGMFTIDRCDEEPFTEQDIEVAMQYANPAAIAITNARLFEQAVDHLHRLEILRKIDSTITSSKDISVALHTVLEQVKVGLRADVASVFLYDEDEQVLIYQQSFGYRTEGNPDHKVPIGQGYVGTVAARKEPLYIPEVDLVDDGHHYPFSLAGEGIVSYYGFPLIAKGRLLGVLQVLQRTRLDPSPEWIEFAEALADQTGIAVDNLTLYNGLERANLELREAYDATIEGWAHALEIRDKETEGHSRRVVLLTEQVALAFGVDSEALVHLRRGVLLHDIGKMGVPDQILHKPGPLDEAEWEIMRQHPVYAYEMLKPIEYLKPALLIPYYHHERWDGSGYPKGLKGEDIPLEARIFAVVDAYDALTSDRPYRGAWSVEETVKYLRQQAGKEFDPAVVKKFLKIVSEQKQ